MALVISGCLKKDIPQKDTAQCNTEYLTQQTYKPNTIQTKTNNGTDYLMSRRPTAKYG